ncbi:HAMP domain-containing protein [Heliobacterium gestii]|uniref:HAMP domain-containing protein n=1 Tax=Heliomicrobium gestii TaxID=2699 RepID=A0A845LEW8_HELGE|nr:methyl-accepting chemotaxis protein [Heliomicrobium gestii]MBM7865832.1 methyl-accepting chemotaxis protein [Heliomicrobium gestii]MZP42073.1 HAMP domain-containing protein [Heliomicrobium gestii]
MRMLSHMKVGTRILLVILISCLIAASVGVYGLSSLSNEKAEMDSMYSNALLPIRYLGEAKAKLQQYRVAVYNHIISTDRQDLNDWEAKTKEYASVFEQELRKYDGTEKSADEKRMLADVQSAWNSYREVAQRVVQASSLATAEGNAKAIMIAHTEGRKIAGDLDDKLERLLQYQADMSEQTKKKSDEAYGTTRMVTVVAIIAAFLLSLTLGFVLARSLSKPLGELEQLAGAIARGDLTKNVDSTDGSDEISSLSRSIHQMVDNLRDFVKHVQSGAQSVAASSEQISASSQQLASGAQSQAQEAQSLSSMMNDMAGAATQVATSAQKAALSSEATTSATMEGGKIIDDTVRGMDAIAENVMVLGQNSEKIGEIVEMIDDIAAQTNLLALNAAIEAARAGDAGKGFAVVADEVRKLAERSGSATKEIGSLIKQIQQVTARAVEATESGRELTQQAGASFQNIKEQVKQTATEVGEIAAAAEEQAATTEQASRAVQNVAAIAEESSAGAQETASAIEAMSALATELQTGSAKYKV